MHRQPEVNPKKHLWWCSILHVINDGYITSLALLLPFIAKDLDLTYTESGLLKTAIHGAISISQVPAGFLACLLYTSPSPRDATLSRMPSSA